MPWKASSSAIILILVLGIIGFFIWQRFFRDDGFDGLTTGFNLPRGGETKTEQVTIDNEPKEIMITDDTKHSVPLNEIVGGGPPKDGIPSIDNPKFVSIPSVAEFLNDEEPGLAVEIDGISRFYPYQILVWHEIVNDTFKSKRVLITYCPLCLSGIVFDPAVNGERVEFGTSGKLWNSNLVMYDRKTDSLWSQILGEAIVGEMTGTKLAILPSDMIRFGDYKKKYPQGEVLSRDTGTTRFYGQDPYGDYYTTPGTFFSVKNKDNRLQEKDFVLGIVVDGKAKAYFPPAIKQKGEITDQFAGKIIVARYEQDIDAVRLFSASTEGRSSSGGEGGSPPSPGFGRAGASGGKKKLERINPFAAFWFSWAAAHPDTELYK